VAIQEQIICRPWHFSAGFLKIPVLTAIIRIAPKAYNFLDSDLSPRKKISRKI
jgi:hypothetical protein